MGAPAPKLPVPLGQVVADKYRLDRIIGAGGMGCVVEAMHLDLHQKVALKFLLEARRDDPECTTRFLREARAAAALTSEHVARVIDTGSLPSGEPFIVLEYLEGNDLDKRIQTKGTLSPEETVSIFMQACDALAEAHARGIVHRDIKPTNLFLAKKPNGRLVVKVLDFGISKLSDPAMAGPSDLTGTATILGTPHYMAPEQMTSTKDAEAPADVWALGVCMYKCLSGRLPFEEAGTLMELGAFVLAQDAPSIVKVAPSVPGPLAAIVMQCLQRDPSHRFIDAGDLLRVLSETGLSLPGSKPSFPSRAAAAQPPPPQHTTPPTLASASGDPISMSSDDHTVPISSSDHTVPMPISLLPTPDSDATRAHPLTPMAVAHAHAHPHPHPPIPLMTSTAFGSPFRPSAAPAAQAVTQGDRNVTRLRPFLLGLFGAVVVVMTILAIRSGRADSKAPTTTTGAPSLEASFDPVPVVTTTSTTTTTTPTQQPTTITIISPGIAPSGPVTTTAPATASAKPKKRVIPNSTHPKGDTTAAPDQR